MDPVEQFFFLVMPGIVVAGAIGATLLHRTLNRDGYGKRKRAIRRVRERQRRRQHPARAHRRARA